MFCFVFFFLSGQVEFKKKQQQRIILRMEILQIKQAKLIYEKKTKNSSIPRNYFNFLNDKKKHFVSNNNKNYLEATFSSYSSNKIFSEINKIIFVYFEIKILI